MLIFLYGSDAYRLKQAKDSLISRYETKYPGGINRFYFDVSEQTNVDSFEDAIRSSTFFNEHKLIVCKNIFSKKTTTELIAKHIKEQAIAQATDITLVAVENLNEKELITKDREAFRLLSDNKNIVKNIEPLSVTKLSEWARKEFEARGCSIEPAALNSLLNMTGNDSWAIVNEIDKLAAYKKGGRLNLSDINLLVLQKTDLSIFNLIDAISTKNKPKALELLYRELKNNRDPYYILTMIVYQFRNLLMVKSLSEQGLSSESISKKSGLHPFVVKKSISCLARFSNPDLKLIYKNLLDIDTNFKQGNSNIFDSLHNFLIKTV